MMWKTPSGRWLNGLADHDVDLIIGTHPHVTQTAEWLTGAEGHTSFVAYSLGNFLNAQSSPDNMNRRGIGHHLPEDHPVGRQQQPWRCRTRNCIA